MFDFTQLAEGFNSFVDGFSDNSDLISDAVNGALFGAVTTAMGGGDILKGAAWGAAGAAVSGAGDTSIFDIAGKGIAGYGIEKALGGDGTIGAATGMLTGYLSSDTETSPEVKTAGSKPEGKAGVTPEGKAGAKDTPTPPPKEQGWLEKYGLQTADGKDTLLGRGLVSAVGAYGSARQREEEQERDASIADRAKLRTKELDEEFDQRNLAGFRQPNMIVRNG